jgi:hypothetical protein
MDISQGRSKKPFLYRLGAAVIAFIAAPASARPLAFFRIGIAAVLLMQAYWLADNLLELYGPRGVVQWEISDQLISDGVPRLSWADAYLKEFDDNDQDENSTFGGDNAVRVVFLIYVVSLACLLLGWRSRLSGGVAWLTHLAMNATGASTIYGVDQFANIGLFYAMWMPLGDCLSLDRYSGRTSGAPSAAARLSLRVLQLHLCIVYLDAGYEKLFNAYFRDGLKRGDIVYAEFWRGEPLDEGKTEETSDTDNDSPDSTQGWVHEDWLDGEAIWVSLMQSDIGPFDFSWLADVPWVAKLMCWGTLVLELGYPVLVWPRYTRKLWVLSMIGMHVGIGVTLWLWSFSFMLIVFNVASFLVSPEPAGPPASDAPVTVVGPPGN